MAQQLCKAAGSSPGHRAKTVPSLRPMCAASAQRVSRGNRHFTVGGGRLRQSGPRPKGRLLRQPALEGLTRSARTDSPRQVRRNKFLISEAKGGASGGARRRRRLLRRGGRRPLRARYGPFNPYIPIRSTTIGKSRVAKDPIAMHTSWRSNSDIASVTSIGYPRMSARCESSTTMHRLLHASGSHPIPPPNDPKSIFSKSGEPVQFSCKKILMKYEFHLLNDILAKSVTVKDGSFDAVTHERFLMMTVIHFGVRVNWSKLLFEILKEMADKSTKRAKGFVAQICVLLNGDQAVILSEAKTFPPLKILSAKTVNTYVATNKTIDARGETDEPEVAKVAIVKKKYVSNKRSASTVIKDTDEVQVWTVAPAVKKKRTAMGRTGPSEKDLALVSVAQDVVPIQIVEPISAVPAERPHAQKQKSPKRKLRLPTGFDDEIVEKEPGVETVVEKQNGTMYVDDIDNIIVRVIAETALMGTDVVEPDVAGGISDGDRFGRTSELISFVTGGRDDKKGEVGSSHGQGQSSLGDGGSSGSRSEPL
ncbi:flagellar associated protein [Dorcoceras hygrometricum]|uniref:Flagellar associated protein n=1 Tax=Dorcoceras hygrometricum TaxID=472368 RepID=A0A2Z7D2H1_9LAMI|nr:flagellar associated protein [Dorcoceras hygrometricum]